MKRFFVGVPPTVCDPYQHCRNCPNCGLLLQHLSLPRARCKRNPLLTGPPFTYPAVSVAARSGPAWLRTAAGGLAPVIFDSTSYSEFSGSAVDSSTHLALFMAGYSTQMTVGLLQDPASAAPGTRTGLSDWSWYDLYNSNATIGNYNYAADPHAAGATFNIDAGKPYGYLLDGSACRAIQVDLAGFLALPREGTTGDAAHHPAGDPATAGAVVPIPFTP